MEHLSRSTWRLTQAVASAPPAILYPPDTASHRRAAPPVRLALPTRHLAQSPSPSPSRCQPTTSHKSHARRCQPPSTGLSEVHPPLVLTPYILSLRIYWTVLSQICSSSFIYNQFIWLKAAMLLRQFKFTINLGWCLWLVSPNSKMMSRCCICWFMVLCLIAYTIHAYNSYSSFRN
jgi:hypothetical protein